MNLWKNSKLKAIIPYHAKHITTGIKLDANENPYSIMPLLQEHMKKWIEEMSLSRYPDTDNTALRKAIGEAYDIDVEKITCGVGSDQLIDCLLRGRLEKGDKVLCPEPSFSMYQLGVALNEGAYIGVRLESDFSYSVEAIKANILKHKPKIIFLCNPNNPTGSVITQEEIESILLMTEALVVVDEAYGEFMEDSSIELTHKYPHLIVLRTFSKAYSLAGARVGYAIANPAIIEMIDSIKPPYNLNVFSQEVGKWVIEHRDLFKPFIQEIIEQRKWLEEELIRLGIKVYPSSANFLWIETALPLEEYLKRECIYIRQIKDQGKVYYRITVGNPDENKVLIKAIKGVKV